ncbi:MAG: transketolase, partial [Acidobacteriota bacterium]
MSTSFSPDLDRRCIDALRLLAVDMVEAAKSGHPGLPLGAAHLAHVVYTRHLRHAPRSPDWPDRDRFVLSAGHGSALLYSMLHFTGYDLSIEECKNFRQWGSKTPGHPEVHYTPGVETTTGPLGQGIANAVGLAMAEQMLAERYNREGHELFGHRTFVIAGDGDLMEGVASEAASLAGHLGLGKLVVLYDDNDISIDGHTDITFTEDVGARFAAFGWQVLHVDGHDLDAIDQGIQEALAETGKPTMVVAKTHIGLDSAVQDSSKAHGSPLGPDNTRALKEKLGWPVDEPFHRPDDVAAAYGRAVEAGQDQVKTWEGQRDAHATAHPELGAELARVLAGELPDGVFDDLPQWNPGDKALATRKASGAMVTALSARVGELAGGSADLAGSNNTFVKEAGTFGEDVGGRNIHFGVREHGMASIANGMALSGIRPYVATFLIFTDYLRPTLRLAAMAHLDVTYIMTHDSIGLGEDGPTHQPVEHLASLRAIPGLTVLRPADANETREAWQAALEVEGPVLLALTRQGLPIQDRPAGADARQGGYVLKEADGGEPKVILIGTGS